MTKNQKYTQNPVSELIGLIRVCSAQFLNFIRPKPLNGVTRHSPIPARGKADGTDFRPVGQTVALELLIEETAIEVFEPFQNRFIRKLTFAECLLCNAEKLCRRAAPTQHIVKKEIMQLVRPDKIFCFLSNIALFIGGKKLGRYRGFKIGRASCRERV